MPMPRLSPGRESRLRAMFRAGVRVQTIADEVGVGIGTVSKYATDEDRAARALALDGAGQPAPGPSPAPQAKARAAKPAALPSGKHERPAPAKGPQLPDPFPQSYQPFVIDTPGVHLILSDSHVPFHDRGTIELAVEAARKRNAVGVLLNGDLLDSHELSDHDKDPSAPRYVEEIELGKRFLAWLRHRLPKSRIVYKLGNHEERADRYIIRRAPALFGLEGVNLQSLLRFDEYGVERVGERRVIQLGKLNVVHGHEYPGGVSSPVNPARGLYLKARSLALAGHHHRTSEHHAKDIRGRAEAAWSVGCSCFLSPAYRVLNDWNLGYALVEVSADGEFSVENKRVLGGKVM